MLDRLEFLVSEALVSMRRNAWMTFASVSTSAMALFVLGSLGYAYLQVSGYVNQLEEDFSISVYLRDDVTPTEIEETQTTIRAIAGVSGSEYVSPEEGLAELQEIWDDVPIAGFDRTEFLPPTFYVRVENVDDASTIAESLRNLPTLAVPAEPYDPEPIRYESEWQAFLSSALRLIRVSGLVLGSITLLTAGILIYNTVRLSIMSRRKEIFIMRLVGSTKNTVNTPMLIEGSLQGTLGGVLAVAVMVPAHLFLERFAEAQQFGSVPAFPTGQMIAVLAATGCGYGLICSVLALRERRERADRKSI